MSDDKQCRDELFLFGEENYNHPISGMTAFFTAHPRTFSAANGFEGGPKGFSGGASSPSASGFTAFLLADTVLQVLFGLAVHR